MLTYLSFPRPFSFHDLPNEIREEILYLACEPNIRPCKPYKKKPHNPRALSITTMSLPRMSRQVRIEVLERIVPKQDFIFTGLRALADFAFSPTKSTIGRPATRSRTSSPAMPRG